MARLDRLRLRRRAIVVTAGPLAAAALVAATCATAQPSAQQAARGAADPAGEATTEQPVDLLSLGAGAVPLAVQADPTLRSTLAHALSAIDGSPSRFVATTRVPAGSRLAFVYQLPAPTVFERFLVPGVLETPSPQQTFFRQVTVSGATAPDGPFVKLADATLEVHARAGQTTALTLHRSEAVRWVRLELEGALDPGVTQAFLEFSEIIGHGQQQVLPPSAVFGGDWNGRGLALALTQAGPVVRGCYDHSGRLEGTISGAILRAHGEATDTGVPSLFIATDRGDGQLLVLRSTNGAPFRVVDVERGRATRHPSCAEPAPPALGCDSVIHGIGFDLDSATLRADAAGLLDALKAGLEAAPAAAVRIEGHTSSEGSEAYNLALSKRRAQAVVDALVTRGLADSRLEALGVGEARPMASNADEAGRSLNRRVEVHCR